MPTLASLVLTIQPTQGLSFCFAHLSVGITGLLGSQVKLVKLAFLCGNPK